MKKIFFIVLSVSLIFVFCACSANTFTDSSENTLLRIIPSEYFENWGDLDEQDYVDYVEDLGDEYITSVSIDDGDVILEMTEEQLYSYIEYTNDILDGYIDEYESYYNDATSVEISDDYTTLYIYMTDDSYGSTILFKRLPRIYVGYALNYMLINDTTDFDLTVKFINANNENIIVEGSAFYDELDYDTQVWEDSYN